MSLSWVAMPRNRCICMYLPRTLSSLSSLKVASAVVICDTTTVCSVRLLRRSGLTLRSSSLDLSTEFTAAQILYSSSFFATRASRPARLATTASRSFFLASRQDTAEACSRSLSSFLTSRESRLFATASAAAFALRATAAACSRASEVDRAPWALPPSTSYWEARSATT
ncbi:hypothetical protein 92L [Ranavirus ambystoma1]|uniref:Uncharacterized protein n=1 Tax=Ranavirus ambystoma1 TaxID=265294 RepID=A0A0U2RV31_9VIRU|nr:hypothetical protein 92L [Ambystoma tigrinum virus]